MTPSMLLVVAAILVGMAVAQDAYAQPTGPVIIGLMIPVTGGIETSGNEAFIASNLAISDFNDHLKQMGAEWWLDPLPYDTEADPETARSVIEAIHSKGINLMVGPMTSANVAAVKPYADEHSLVVLSCCSSAPTLAVADDSVFRLVPDDRGQAVAIIKLLEERGIDVLVPIWRADTYGDGLVEAIRDRFEAVNGTVHTGVRYSPFTDNLSLEVAILDKYLREVLNHHDASNVAVLMTSFEESVWVATEAARYDSLDDVAWFASESVTLDAAFTEDDVSGVFAEEVGMTAAELFVEHGQKHDAVINEIESHLDQQPSVIALASYDAIWVMGLAVLEANSTDPMLVREALPVVTKGFDGVLTYPGLSGVGDALPVGHSIVQVVQQTWIPVGKYFTATGELALD